MKTHKSVIGEQRYKLFKFIESLGPDDNRTYREIAIAATPTLGFPVTQNMIEYHWVAVHGNRNVRVNKQQSIQERLDAIEGRLDDLESLWK
jgi:hypothetical protein